MGLQDEKKQKKESTVIKPKKLNNKHFNSTSNVQMEEQAQKKQKKESTIIKPKKFNDKPSNSTHKVKTGKKKGKGHKAKPIAKKHSTSHVMVEPTTEVKRESSNKAEYLYNLDRFVNNTHVQMEHRAEKKESNYVKLKRPVHWEYSAINEKMAEEKNAPLNTKPTVVEQSTSPVRVEPITEVTQERSNKTEDLHDLSRSANNVHVQMEHRAEKKEKNESISVKMKNFNNKPFNQTTSTRNLKAGKKEDTRLNAKPIANKHSTSYVTVAPAKGVKRERLSKAEHDSYTGRSPKNLQVQKEHRAEKKEKEGNLVKPKNVNNKPFNRTNSASNVKVKPTTEVKRGRSNKTEDRHDPGRSTRISPMRMENQAEKKEKKESISVKPKTFNDKPFNRTASARNLKVKPTTEFKQARSNKTEDLYDPSRSARISHVQIDHRAERREKKEGNSLKPKNFTNKPFNREYSARNVTMERQAEMKEKKESVSVKPKSLNNKPFNREYHGSNVKVESTTHIKRDWPRIAEDLYGADSIDDVHVQVEHQADKKEEKESNFNDKPFSLEYSASNVKMGMLPEGDQQNSLDGEDPYDMSFGKRPLHKDENPKKLKVEYLVMSFNETTDDTPTENMRDLEDNGLLRLMDNETLDQNFACPAEFTSFPDPNGDCNVYYTCRNWTLERKTCSRDLHFNPITRVCDYPSKAVCDIKCIKENDRYPVPGYCNMYLDCVKGMGKYIRCAESLHYNAVTKQCDSPTKAACEINCPRYNTLVALPGRCNMFGNCEEGHVTYHLCPSGLHFNPVTLKCDAPESEECKIECLSSNGYFPVLGQCTNYIECQNNHGRVISCPSGLHFNFMLQTCDIPSQAGCELKCKRPNGYFPFPGVCSYFIMCMDGTPFLKKCPGDLEFNQDTNQCDIVAKDHCLPYCPIENGIFPIDNHCGLYMRCTRGQPLVKRCPPGLHFNALFKHCDLPENAKCEFPCPYPSGIFPLPGKCTKFVRCENDMATTLTCAEGLHFNARTQTCDWPPAAQCEISCPEWEGYFPVQGACNAYVTCTEGRPMLKKCPYGKHFNLESKQCDNPEYANCEFVCLVTDGLFTYPGHCDSYIHCENNMPHIDTCPPGLLFNTETAVCDLPENVHCYS